MYTFIKNYWKILVFFTVVGLIGGFFTSLYAFDLYPESIRQEITVQGMTKDLLAVVGAVQSAGYGLILGALGIILSKKVGLWKDKLAFSKKPLVITAISALIGGLCMILPDVLFFGKYSQAIMDSYSVKPTVPLLIAMVTYAGVIEEVMLRLFMMSLIAFILHKLFDKGKQYTSAWVLIVANILSALLFAAGHLPATFLTIGSSPMILFRCFLLNGGFGIVFGWLYRKYGLQYAMLAHGGCHAVSKLIWILLI